MVQHTRSPLQIIAPYVKIITCIHSLHQLQKYLQMQKETTTDSCSQSFFEKQSLTNDHAAACHNGEHHAGTFWRLLEA